MRLGKKITVEKFLRQVIEERNVLYDTRFKAGETAIAAALAAQEKAVSAALTAAEKITNAAFTASEKAIVKAEDAQREYNARSNEFRGQLDDQAKTLLSRTEATALLKGLEDRLIATKKEVDNTTETLRATGEKAYDGIAKEIAALREYRSERGGAAIASRELIGYIFGAIGILTAIIFHFMK